MAKAGSIERLRQQLLRVPKEAQAEIRKALTIAAEQITTTQRSFAPVEDGTLRDSIRHSPMPESSGRFGVQIEAGGPTTTRIVRDGQSATYDYALAKEFGTKNAPAESFFFPGYRANKKRAKARVNRAIKKAAKAAVSR
jgi:HK97 gp10 family phage protein